MAGYKKEIIGINHLPSVYRISLVENPKRIGAAAIAGPSAIRAYTQAMHTQMDQLRSIIYNT